AAAKPDEKIVEFALYPHGIGGGGGFGQRAVAFAKRGGIARQGGQRSECSAPKPSGQFYTWFCTPVRNS
ncbi:MAG: hypothetical protein ACK5R5_03585, partial [Alphaproteobacteria bacterium]